MSEQKEKTSQKTLKFPFKFEDCHKVVEIVDQYPKSAPQCHICPCSDFCRWFKSLVAELEKLLDKCNDWTQLSEVLGLDFTPDYLTAHKVSKAVINKILEAISV